MAQEAGVSASGSGFRGSSFHFITDSRDAVDEVMRAAAAAGGTVVKAAAPAEWGSPRSCGCCLDEAERRGLGQRGHRGQGQTRLAA
ncbi:hypothetical protein GCM10023319_04090 [Nocardia iowensis]